MTIEGDGTILAAGVAATNGNIWNPKGSQSPVLAHIYAGSVNVAGALVTVAPAATPVLSLSGAGSVAAGTPYTLTIGDGGSDLGSGPCVSYVVNWGDGQATTVWPTPWSRRKATLRTRTPLRPPRPSAWIWWSQDGPPSRSRKAIHTPSARYR